MFDALLPEERESSVYLAEIFLAQQYQGRGFGKKLLFDFEQRMRDQGITQIVLRTHAFNEKLRSMYERAGYNEICQGDFPVTRSVNGRELPEPCIRAVFLKRLSNPSKS